MKHNVRCENANPKGKCKCRCGGSLHAKNRMDNENPNYERTITESLGGEIETTLKELNGKTIKCSCGNDIIINGWLGYPHDGGLIDKEGNKWWIYVECPKCNYDWSWHKLPNRIERLVGM